MVSSESSGLFSFSDDILEESFFDELLVSVFELLHATKLLIDIIKQSKKQMILKYLFFKTIPPFLFS